MLLVELKRRHIRDALRASHAVAVQTRPTRSPEERAFDTAALNLAYYRLVGNAPGARLALIARDQHMQTLLHTWRNT